MIKDIPTGEHWAIITDRSIRIPGDERSRTNPGHGYPESTHEYIEYSAYSSEEDMRKAATARLRTSGSYGKSFTCLHVLASKKPKITAEIDWK